jgi:predicted nuclease with TOPRIM domain
LQLDDLKSEITDLTNQVDGLDSTVTEVKEGFDEQTSTGELVDDERVRELIRDFVNDGGIEIVTT